MKVRITLTNGQRHVGDLKASASLDWLDIVNSRGKAVSFPSHAVLMVEEI